MKAASCLLTTPTDNRSHRSTIVRYELPKSSNRIQREVCMGLMLQGRSGYKVYPGTQPSTSLDESQERYQFRQTPAVRSGACGLIVFRTMFRML